MKRYRVEFDRGNGDVRIQHGTGMRDVINKVELATDHHPEMQRVTIVRIDAEPPEGHSVG